MANPKLRKISLSVGVLFLHVGMSSCQTDAQNEQPMDLFEWQPGLGAPMEYPVEVYKGYFYNKEEVVPVAGGGVLESGWGEDDMKMTTGQTVPDSFSVTYLSFVENKFYGGRFALPHDTMLAMFREGVISNYTKQRTTYQSIILGMAPGGIVVVWMYADGRQVDIGRYQASEVQVDWNSFNPQGVKNRDLYVRNILNTCPKALRNLKENGIQFGLWDTYRTRYNWRPKMVAPEPFKMSGYWIFPYNAEREVLFDESLDKNLFSKRGIPKEMTIKWYDETGQKHGADFYFDEREAFDAYGQIYRAGKDQEGELSFRLNEQRNGFAVYLQNETEEILLRKTRQKVYKTHDYGQK